MMNVLVFFMLFKIGGTFQYIRNVNDYLKVNIFSGSLRVLKKNSKSFLNSNVSYLDSIFQLSTVLDLDIESLKRCERQ